ncbi:hypothetical protein [Halobellus sp. GM3]|uniref:hypothetical protein n=1 Tax=Halobellus sp. GM3 TaxID=3458410 RepID=UPI00403DA0CC
MSNGDGDDAGDEAGVDAGGEAGVDVESDAGDEAGANAGDGDSIGGGDGRREGDRNGLNGGTEDAAFAVPTATESDAETAWRRELAERGELTPGAVDTLMSLHDGRGARAIEAVSEGRIKRYRDFTVVVGHEDEYVVEAGGCTCKDSSYNLDPDDPHERCWHVLAVAIAERIGEVDHHEMWYSEVRDFL